MQEIVCWLVLFIFVSINAHFLYIYKKKQKKKQPKKKKNPWSCFYYLLDIVNKTCWHASQHRPEFLKCPVLVHKSSHALFFIHYREMCNIHASSCP